MPGRLRERMAYEHVMMLIREVKQEAEEAATAFKSGAYISAVGRAKRVWGFAPTYYYNLPSDPNWPNYEESTRKMLLAALIAERHLLFKFRGLRKHATVSIVGLAGSGKTTYSVLSGIGAHLLVGYAWRDAVEYTARLIFFTPRSLVDTLLLLLKNAKSNPAEGWVPFLIIDDAGSQISKYWYMLGEKHFSHLFSILDQVKDFTGMVIVTARKEKSLPARLREITDFYVEASEAEIEGIVVDVFKWYKGDDFERGPRWRFPRMQYLDAMPPLVRMPKEIWDAMMHARAETAEQRLSVLKEALEIAPKAEEVKLEELKRKLESKKEELKDRAEEALARLEEVEGEVEGPSDRELDEEDLGFEEGEEYDEY